MRQASAISHLPSRFPLASRLEYVALNESIEHGPIGSPPDTVLGPRRPGQAVGVVGVAQRLNRRKLLIIINTPVRAAGDGCHLPAVRCSGGDLRSGIAF